MSCQAIGWPFSSLLHVNRSSVPRSPQACSADGGVRSNPSTIRSGRNWRSSSADVVLDVSLEPILCHDAGPRRGDSAVGCHQQGRRRRHDPVGVADLTRAVHQELISEPMAIDEVTDLSITLLNTDGEDLETLVPVVLVGRPKLGCTGVVCRSPGVHEGDGDRLTAKVAQRDGFAVGARKLEIGGCLCRCRTSTDEGEHADTRDHRNGHSAPDHPTSTACCSRRRPSNMLRSSVSHGRSLWSSSTDASAGLAVVGHAVRPGRGCSNGYGFTWTVLRHYVVVLFGHAHHRSRARTDATRSRKRSSPPLSKSTVRVPWWSWPRSSEGQKKSSPPTQNSGDPLTSRRRPSS